jgi:hypothetical protein
LIHCGELAPAGEILGQALAEARKLGLLWPMWQIQAGLAQRAEATSRADEAERYRQEARQTFETIAGRISDPALRDSFMSRADF